MPHVHTFRLFSSRRGFYAGIGARSRICTRPPGADVGHRSQVADEVVGASASFLFVVGLSRVFFFEKGAGYYFHEHAFLTKFSVFIAVALLSIIPTIEFFSWRKPVRAGQLPPVGEQRLRFIRKIIHIELVAVVVILLCAAIMARGGWV